SQARRLGLGPAFGLEEIFAVVSANDPGSAGARFADRPPGTAQVVEGFIGDHEAMAPGVPLNKFFFVLTRSRPSLNRRRPVCGPRGSAPPWNPLSGLPTTAGISKAG